MEEVKILSEKLKFDQSINIIAECLVGDAHGCGILIARNGKLWGCKTCEEQLEVVKKGALINIKNALAKVMDKRLKIDLDKWSQVTASEEVKLAANKFISLLPLWILTTTSQKLNTKRLSKKSEKKVHPNEEVDNEDEDAVVAVVEVRPTTRMSDLKGIAIINNLLSINGRI